MAQVTLDNLDKTYPGNVVAVSGLSLDIADGELMVMVGPSGCGKTTTLRMVAGLERPTGGTVSIGGRVVNGLPPKDRDVAMVFQNFALYPHKTVYQNMAFGLAMRRVPGKEIESRIQAAARTLKLEELLDRRPRALSGGQQQRVALGRAMVREPGVFLFDEPLSNLDVRLRGQMRMEIGRLHRELGATMFYVTHDQSEAMTLGERIVVVNRGMIQQVADPITLYERPANRFVATFIGTPPMNFLDGRIGDRDGLAVFSADSAFVVPLPGVWRDRLIDYDQKAITLGIRPQHITCMPTERRPDDAPFEARIELVETLGVESLVHLQTGGTTLTSCMRDSRDLTPGERLRAFIHVNWLHFFDPDSGQSVL